MKDSITILTLNVNAYRGRPGGPIGGPHPDHGLFTYLSSCNADIICLQEHRHFGPKCKIKGYILASTCRTVENIENAIFIKKGINLVQNYSLDITAGAPVQRCASFITIKSPYLTLANIHLCGGRYDDRKYQRLMSVKADEIKSITKGILPDFIVGDFNAESNDSGALNQLTRYPLFKRLKLDNKYRFYQYYTSHHTVLHKYGYQSVSIDTQTSIYGGNPDQIYFQGSRWRPVETTVINLLDCTDHNAVMTTFISR